MSIESDFKTLLAAARGGDEPARDALFSGLYEDVQAMTHQRLWRELGSSRRWVSSRFSTGDVVHEVLRVVLQDLDGFRGDSVEAFKGYLSIIVRNRIVDSVRHHSADRRDVRRSVDVEACREGAGKEPNPAEAAARQEQVARIEQHIETLEPRERLLLRARMEGLATFQELAHQLGYESESGARKAFYSAQSRLLIAIKGDTEA